jgi:NADH-quinone oxidoreductase subunit F
VQVGLWGRPTVVNNVETLSNIPIIINLGAEGYKEIGPMDYPGPKLFPVSGKVKKPGVYELPMNTTLREVIFKYAGGTIRNVPIKAVFSGALDCLGLNELDTPMDYSQFGFGGTGTVIVLTEEDDIVDACYKIAEFYEHETCGFCTPCRIGCHDQAYLLDKILKTKLHLKRGKVLGLWQSISSPLLFVVLGPWLVDSSNKLWKSFQRILPRKNKCLL